MVLKLAAQNITSQKRLICQRKKPEIKRFLESKMASTCQFGIENGTENFQYIAVAEYLFQYFQ